MNPLVRIYSHPRSGTNFIEALLHRNFYWDSDLSTQGGLWGHWSNRLPLERVPFGRLFGSHALDETVQGPAVYIYRDGRSVALSVWKSDNFLHKSTRALDFSEFLRTPLDWQFTPANRVAPTTNIIQHWYGHVLLAQRLAASRDDLVMVRYEDLLTSPRTVLNSISERFGLRLHPDGYQGEPEPVGPSPNFTNHLTEWKSYFTANDLELFHQIVPVDFPYLWSSDSAACSMAAQVGAATVQRDESIVKSGTSQHGASTRDVSDRQLEVHSPLKIAFFAGDGGNFHFAEDIIADLERRGHDVRAVRSASMDMAAIEGHMRWSDVSWFEWALGPIVPASRLPKVCRVVCRLHRHELYSTAPREINWRSVDDLIFVSPTMVDVFRELHDPSIDRLTNVHVIPNTVDLAKLDFKQRAPGFEVAFVARFHPVKSPALMLQVMAALVKADSRYRCHVVGRVQDLTEFHYFKHMVHAMGLENNVIYDGHIRDVSAWLEDKDYLLSTSVIESQGVGIMEAMAKGIKPVIHNYFGDPGRVFDPKYVFNTVEEAVEMIRADDYESAKYRALIEQRYAHQAGLDRVHEVLLGRRQPVGSELADDSPEQQSSSKRGARDEALKENRMGEEAFAAGDVVAAGNHFERAVQYDPELGDAWNNLGVVGWETGELAAALKALLRCLGIEPGHRDALRNAARVLCALGKVAEASELLEAYLELHPADVELRGFADSLRNPVDVETELGDSGRDRPLFSIIIPTKNRPEMLRRALQSVLAQNETRWETIIVNDGGCRVDELVNGLDGSGRMRCINLPSSGGPSAARNSGLAVAKGELIAYLDDDDRFLPNHLRALAQAFVDPKVHVAYTEAEYVYEREVDGSTIEVSRDRPYSGIGYSRERLLVQNFIPMIVLAHRKSCLDRVVGFDESFSALVDWELFLRLAEHYEFRHIPQITVEAHSRAEIANVSRSQRANFPQLFARIYARHSDGGNVSIRQARDEMLRQLFAEVAAAAPPAKVDAHGRRDEADELHTALYREWLDKRQLQEADAQLMAERMLKRWERNPSIQLITVAQAGSETALASTLESLGKQLYKGWGLTVLSNAPMPDSLFESGANLEWIEATPADFVETLNRSIHDTGADWVAMLDAGDRLAPQALFSFADYANLHRGWRLIYCDSDVERTDGSGPTPRFLPEFNAELLRSTPYFGNFCLVARDSLEALGGVRAVPGCEMYDLAFRIFEKYGEVAIGHVPDVLFHQREENHDIYQEISVRDTACRVVAGHLERIGEPARVTEGLLPGSHHIEYAHATQPLVSIIIPTKDRLDLLKPCVQSLLEKTSYPNFEVLVVDNNSSDAATLDYLDSLHVGSAKVKVLRYPHPYNFSAINNFAAREAKGEYLLLLNNDTQIVQEQWLERMMAHGQRPEVGIVGARLLFADQRIQHAGVVLGMVGAADHVHIGLPMTEAGHLGRAQLAQNYSAVTAACLLIRRVVYEEVHGLDEDAFKVLFNDVDLCLKVGERGYKVVYTPFASVVHHGSSSLKSGEHRQQAPKEPIEAYAMFEKWLPKLASDPAYNRNLSLTQRDCRPETDIVPGWNADFHDRPRIVGFPQDSWGCGQYRVKAPLAGLERAVLAQVSLVPDSKQQRIPQVAELARMEPDVLLLQSFLQDGYVKAIELYRRFLPKVRLMFELDDLKTEMPSSNPKARTMPHDVGTRLAEALSCCDRMIVSTEPLKEAYSHLIDDIVVVPNRLERSRWGGLRSARRAGAKPRVGWAGAQQHHGDLVLLREVVEATADEVEWVFFGMCPQELRPHIREFHEGVMFDAYPTKLASLNLDLAVAPVEINRFNEAKSNLRLLEYGIMGWPVVCTDIEPYRAHNAPVTRVANTTSAWVEAIRSHVHDLDACEGAGDRLRAWVQRHWMLEDHLGSWLTALTQTESAPSKSVAVGGR